MFQQTFAIIRNTFLESIRQPIMLVILIVATLALLISNPTSAFTMANDQRMLIDLGLATVFVCGMLLASFIATNVLGREIENRTALTVISKPLSRPLFVLGKYFGVAGAMAMGTLYMSLVFMLVEQHTVLQTVRDPIHVPVILFGTSAVVIGVGVGIWCNFFYNRVFSSTVICTTTPLLALAYVLSLMFRPDFGHQDISRSFKPQLWVALAALMIAILVLTAIAVAASTRLGQVLTLCITIGVFLLGMMSDWVFGRQLAQYQNTWTQRVNDMSTRELEALLENVNVNSLRGWTQELYQERAERELAAAQCAGRMKLFKARSEAKSLPDADRKLRMEAIEIEQQNVAKERYQAALTEARQAADEVRMPLSKQLVVHKLDWPQTVQRINGECDSIKSSKVFVYPALLQAASTSSERLANGACRIAYSMIPNFQVLLLSDAVTQDHIIPIRYLAVCGLYGGLFIIASLGAATFLFQRREVG